MAAVDTTASGITKRGKCILRTRFSRCTTEETDAPVAAWKKLNKTMFINSRTGKSGTRPKAFFRITPKTRYSTPKNISGCMNDHRYPSTEPK